MPRVAFLLGKPPKPGTLLAEVAALLAHLGVSVEVVLPHEGGINLLARLGDLTSADLVVHRGLSAQVDPLLAAIDAAGTPLCNPWAGSRRVRTRDDIQTALLTAGVPTPRGREVDDWGQVLALAEQAPVVVKLPGSGRGAGVLTSSAGLPNDAPGPGPYRLEPLLQHDGMDRKLYVAGSQVHGLLKPSTLSGEHTTTGAHLEVGPRLRELALATAAALDLHLLGVDVVGTGEDDLHVVDVNAFPGFRSVPGATGAVTAHLLAHLGRGAGTR